MREQAGEKQEVEYKGLPRRTRSSHKKSED